MTDVPAPTPSPTPAPAEPEKPPPKKLGPIRWKMIIAIVVLWVGTFVGVYVMRDTIVHRGVESGGRSAFQTAVTLDSAKTGLSPAKTAVDLHVLQIPDRDDLSRNAIQAEQIELEVSPLDLLSGQVHVNKARAKNVLFDVKRATPAEPLPLTGEPAPVDSDDGGLGGWLGGLGQGGIIEALTVGEKPFMDVVRSLGLETVAYAEGVPRKIEMAQKQWGPKLEAHKKELEALQARSKELQPQVDALAKSIREEWSKALADKKKKFDELEAALKKDSKAAGNNPVVDIPRRVETELADLDKFKASQEARTAQVRGDLKKLEDDLTRLAGELEKLDREAKLAQQELANEVAKARQATKNDMEKIKGWVDPSGDRVEELIHILCGPRTAAQVKAGRKWVGLLWKLMPPKKQRIGPPRTPREGVDVPIPPPPGGEVAAREAAARLIIDDLELDGTLTLEDGPLALAGHVLNFSDAPFMIGREIGLDLDAKLGEGAGAKALKITGGIDPDKERTRIEVACAGVPLQGVTLQEGEPGPNDLFPRKLEKVTLDLRMKIDSSPEAFTTAIESKMTDLVWGSAPAGGGPPAVRAVRDVLAGVKGLHFAIEMTMAKGKKPVMTVKDLSQPSLTEKLRSSITAAVQGEVDKITAGYQGELEKLLAKQGDANQSALAAANSDWAKQLAAATGLQKQAAPAGTGTLDQAVSSGDEGKKALAKNATEKLLAAATQGGFNIPKLPFGKD